MTSTGTIRIGISGWRYAGWRGVFYPPRLGQRHELEFASSIFPTIEINGTFYSLQRPANFRHWAASTPDGFVFAIKGSRYLTHMLKLQHVEQPLANFFASGLLELGDKLGPILWQFAPRMHFDPDRFAHFFKLLPRTFAEAACLATQHDAKLYGRATTGLHPGTDPSTPLRHCIEVRDESFATPECIALLREHNIALVTADTVAWPLLFDITSDFIYCRLHGSEELYTSGYGDDALDRWATRAVAWAHGESVHGRCASSLQASCSPRDVYLYFDNDAKVRAPADAKTLQRKIDDRIQKMVPTA